MYSKIYSSVLYGITGLQVEIEVNLSRGLPVYQIVGLPDKTVRESKERIRAAVESVGVKFPAKRVTLNLIPAEIPKDGSHLDLPMAIGILASLGELEQSVVKQIAFFGELSLDGRLMDVPGILPMVEATKTAGVDYVVVPQKLEKEAALIQGVKSYGAKTLEELLELLKSEDPFKAFTAYNAEQQDFYSERMQWPQAQDFEHILGQEGAKRALMIAAAGFHNILVAGPPGCGKSMMMHAFRYILPPLSKEEAVEVKRIKGIRKDGQNGNLPLVRPFRKPHHNVTMTALMGGGSKPKPGELTQAHRGVLFLDELTEYKRDAIESMRQALEDGYIHISRVHGQVELPSEILLCATMNPCKCGYLFSEEKECTCSDREVKNYLGRISGPILDRIDLVFEVQSVDMSQTAAGMNTNQMREAVMRAYAVQKKRFENTRVYFNSQMKGEMLTEYCSLDAQAEHVLNESSKAFNLSKRVQNKLLMIARTISDFEGAQNIMGRHMAEAVQYRIAVSRLRGDSI